MANPQTPVRAPAVSRRAPGVRTERAWVRSTVVVAAVLFLTVFLVLPLATVLHQAFVKGLGP